MEKEAGCTKSSEEFGQETKRLKYLVRVSNTGCFLGGFLSLPQFPLLHIAHAVSRAH